MSQETAEMIQQVNAEKFSDFRDTVINSLNDRIRDTQQVKNAGSQINNYNNIKELFSQIKDSK